MFTIKRSNPAPCFISEENYSITNRRRTLWMGKRITDSFMYVVLFLNEHHI